MKINKIKSVVPYWSKIMKLYGTTREKKELVTKIRDGKNKIRH